MTYVSNREMAEKLFADTFCIQGKARHAFDTAERALAQADRDMQEATALLHRVIANDIPPR